MLANPLLLTLLLGQNKEFLTPWQCYTPLTRANIFPASSSDISLRLVRHSLTFANSKGLGLSCSEACCYHLQELACQQKQQRISQNPSLIPAL